MNVEIGAEAVQFLFWEYINVIFVVYVYGGPVHRGVSKKRKKTFVSFFRLCLYAAERKRTK
jgi:hypothetical protein